ncbi:MAG: cytochrome P450, partial [Proteobacteria bacterium]
MNDHVLTTPSSAHDDLLSDEAINRPFAFYASLRESDPVHYNPQWGGWVITRYD